MITYSRGEIISSSRIAKNLGQILAELKKGILQRAVISKNNQLEAVILPIEEYEKVMKLAEVAEHLELAGLIEDRASEPAETSFEEVLAKSGIVKDEL